MVRDCHDNASDNQAVVDDFQSSKTSSTALVDRIVMVLYGCSGGIERD